VCLAETKDLAPENRRFLGPRCIRGAYSRVKDLSEWSHSIGGGAYSVGFQEDESRFARLRIRSESCSLSALLFKLQYVGENTLGGDSGEKFGM
jgi:hypothetical protein